MHVRNSFDYGASTTESISVIWDLGFRIWDCLDLGFRIWDFLQGLMSFLWGKKSSEEMDARMRISDCEFVKG